MYVPIFPSTGAHPSGREPVQPNRPFPFPDCSHWVGTVQDIRVKKGKYDVLTDKGHFLDGGLKMRTLNWLAEDFQRSRMTLYEASYDATSVVNDEEDEPDSSQCHSPIDYDNTDKMSFPVCSSEIASEYSFKSVDENLFPVVDAWFELEEHIAAEQMTSPLEFVKERAALLAYVFSCLCRDW